MIDKFSFIENISMRKYIIKGWWEVKFIINQNLISNMVF